MVRYFRSRGRARTLAISRSRSGEVISSSRRSSATSRIWTEGAFGERASAAEMRTFASATTRSIRRPVALGAGRFEFLAREREGLVFVEV